MPRAQGRQRHLFYAFIARCILFLVPSLQISRAVASINPRNPFDDTVRATALTASIKIGIPICVETLLIEFKDAVAKQNNKP